MRNKILNKKMIKRNMKAPLERNKIKNKVSINRFQSLYTKRQLNGFFLFLFNTAVNSPNRAEKSIFKIIRNTIAHPLSNS